MLRSLNIRNFILIDKLELDFSKEFNVITGQTGAGKSILLDSILFCFGQKINKEVIKAGCEIASVTSEFDVNTQLALYLEENDIEIFEDMVIIKRILNISGRNKFLVNDQPVSKKIILELFDMLIEMHGQHIHTNLLNLDEHIKILDEFIGNKDIIEYVNVTSKKVKAVESSIQKMEKNKESVDREIEYLEYNIAELQKLNIQDQEFEELNNSRHKLQSKDREIKLLNGLMQQISNSDIEQTIVRSCRDLSKSIHAERYEKIQALLDAVYDKIEEIRSIVNYELEHFSDHSMSLEEIDERIHDIRHLARKHNCAPEELYELNSKMPISLSALREQNDNLNELYGQLSELKKQYLIFALNLSNIRRDSADILEKKVHLELAKLEMPKTKFQIRIERDDNLISEKGIDNVSFIASTNPGMPAYEINKIASGGELSRFMLALRAALHDVSSSKTIIFDEIDVGISGSIADSIGMRLKEISKYSQLIVITHQAQVAGKADNHLLVHKEHLNNDTIVKVLKIEGEEKATEVARMISGQKITEAGMRAAQELIEPKLATHIPE